jgi:hypothetical protein
MNITCERCLWEVQKGFKLEKIQEWEVEEKRDLLQLWHQRPFCKRMSQKETRLGEKIQRFFTSSNNKQNWISYD